LIRVHATTVSRTDYHILTGKPFFMRLLTGLSKPKLSITGTDFAGQVEATGKNVTTFKTGDRVMGFGGSFPGIQSHAQYMLLSEERAKKATVEIPGQLNYEEAAACIEGAFYASGFTLLHPKEGQTALVY